MAANDQPDSDRHGNRRRPGELEAEIITALVGAGRALTPAEVRERLDWSPPLSYSTVVTTLTRLFDKDAVTRQRDGRAYRYAAVTDAPALVAGRMGRLLRAEADHASVLRRFVSALDEQDEQLLRRLLLEAGD
ncbi:Transcriptional regulator BlaI [Micromonospora sp. MW-13]|uniref:BlaI/MecI/CopY family transcriptional regulator n=1 Tax=unclassified Micromonospora TaxID=2617518 RepID=UPI000E430D02|nr:MULTISPECIES: BlaI/MecI/CopY family transcriptional regulator [unclassified Micromonospora]MCX4471749.1 BlaI/MecI/CopY family transcriptional regulator [Micromonospora sp. NBC_01655]RGC66981.1 Transcriptional regulator BlaI [Micromonospora sp. MW-13]